MKYLATVRYLGCYFCGFQTQKNGRTVQETLTMAFTRLFGCRCLITGASRTDSGVHALGARVTVVPENGLLRVPPERLPYAVAPFLPRDLTVTKAELVSDDFHVRHDVKRKQYFYLIRTAPVFDPFWDGRAWQFPCPIPQDGVSKMNKAAAYLTGEHDFSAFMAAGSPVKSTVRTLQKLAVTKEGEMLRITAEADGFLYNMVRILVGTLLDCALGKIEPDDIPSILESHDRTKSGETAPPQGLYLHFIEY